MEIAMTHQAQRERERRDARAAYRHRVASTPTRPIPVVQLSVLAELSRTQEEGQ